MIILKQKEKNFFFCKNDFLSIWYVFFFEKYGNIWKRKKEKEKHRIQLFHLIALINAKKIFEKLENKEGREKKKRKSVT